MYESPKLNLMKTSMFTFLKTTIGVCLLLLSFKLSAATITFTNGGSDNLWSNASNWSSFSTPGNLDDVIINNGTLTVDVDIDVKSLSIGATADVTFTHTGVAEIGTLTMSGGSLNSANKIIVSDGLNWTGTSSITNTAALELSATSVSAISGTGNRNLYAQIVNNGTIIHSDGSLRFQTGGSLVNNGTYTVDGATFMIATGGGAFTNNGIFNKNSTNELNMFVAFNGLSTGVVNANEGTLKFLADVSFSGTSMLSIDDGAKVDFSNGVFSFVPGTSINGAGDLIISGGTATIEGSFNVSGETIISNGIVNFNSTSQAIFSELSLSAGTLQGSSQLLVLNTFNWKGTSSLKNSDTLKIADTAIALIFSSGTRKLYTIIENEGTISHTAGNMQFYSGGKIINNGTYFLNGPDSINDNGGDGYENNGLFKHQSTGTVNIKPDFNNNIDGIISGKGKMKFRNLTNIGSFAAEAADGILSVDGSFDNGSDINIGFDNAVHGELEVSDDVSLSGAINVDAVGVIPQGVYTILSSTSGTISGTFDTENIPSNASILYNTSEVSLMVGLLPVELTHFSVRVKSKTVELLWQTVSEINSDKFIIEHSQNGIDFRAIGEVAAAGSSQGEINYDFIHDDPTNGINYYRLRQVDLDDKFEFSDLRVLNFYNFDGELSVYPNPTHGNVIVKNQSDKVLKLRIMNLGGKVVYVRNEVLPGAISLDLKHLPKGMYTLDFSDETFYSHKEKLMILE